MTIRHFFIAQTTLLLCFIPPSLGSEDAFLSGSQDICCQDTVSLKGNFAGWKRGEVTAGRV